MRTAVLALTFIALPHLSPDAAGHPARPRRFDVGATVSSACLTSESACGDGTYPLTGVYASRWPDPRIEIGGRVAWLTRPDSVFVVSRDARFRAAGAAPELAAVTVSRRDRSRVYATGHIYRHFGPDPRARLFAGIAIGSYWDRWTADCQPATCEPLMSLVIGGPPGRRSHRNTNVAFGAGVSGQARIVRWRAGLQLHNFPGEHAGTTELFAGAGVNF
jgi:hypothetical protein